MEKEYKLTLREYYTEKILAMLIAKLDENDWSTHAEIAKESVKLADLVIKELNESDGEEKLLKTCQKFVKDIMEHPPLAPKGPPLETLNENIKINSIQPKESYFDINNITIEKFTNFPRTCVSTIPKISKEIYIKDDQFDDLFIDRFKREVKLLRQYWSHLNSKEQLKNIKKNLDNDFNGVYTKLEYIHLSNEIYSKINDKHYTRGAII